MRRMQGEESQDSFTEQSIVMDSMLSLHLVIMSEAKIPISRIKMFLIGETDCCSCIDVPNKIANIS